jgi:tetratricopeptide (TPR) repeat protein
MYVGKIIYPFHQSIMPNIIDTPILPNIIMTLVLIALYIYAWKTNKSYTLFGLIIIFSIISIPLFWGTVMGMANAFEHRIYILIIGVIFSLSRIKYSEILSRSFITTAIVLFLLIYSVTSISRSAVYADEQSFTESVVNESPSIWQAHALIADYYAKTPNHHKAIEEYSIAIDMTTDPNPNTLIYSRGTQYQNIRDFTHALEDYSIIILRDPEFSDVYYNKGLIHKELGDYQLAISNISHAISLDSNRHEFYKGRGESYIKTRQYQLAMEEFSKVLLKEPEDILSLNNRCVALFFLKDYKSAYYELTLIESLGGEVNPEFKKAILDKYSILVR